MSAPAYYKALKFHTMQEFYETLHLDPEQLTRVKLAFKKNRVNVFSLARLTDEDLYQMGIVNVYTRVCIVKNVN